MNVCKVLYFNLKVKPNCIHDASADVPKDAKSVNLLWSRDRCQLLKNDDVILVDSPGVDIDEDFDACIDEHCSDADLFVLVLNAESTLMMREKAFFQAVASKIAKPNILILFNHWDCSDHEENKDQVKAQHLERACKFLAFELKVAASLEEASRQVYFVSAKKAIQGQRSRDWSLFCNYIEACLDIAGQGAKFGPLIDAGREMAFGLDQVQGHIYSLAKTLHTEILEEKTQLEQRILGIKTNLDILVDDWKQGQLAKVMNQVDLVAFEAFRAELDDSLAHIIYDFQAPLPNLDAQVVKLYKMSLLTHVEVAFASSLKSRLAIQLLHLVESTQGHLTQNLALQQPLASMPPIERFDLACIKFDLQNDRYVNEPVTFAFSLGPRRLLQYMNRLYCKIRGKEGPKVHEGNEWSSWTKFVITATAIMTEGQLVIAGLVFKYFGSSRVLSRILASMAITYAGLYGIERLSWAFCGKERQIKANTLALTCETLAMAEPLTRVGIKGQVKTQLNTFMGVACGTVEAFQADLKDSLEKVEEESKSLQLVINTCANLSNDIQAVLFDFDAAERVLLNQQQ